MKCVSDARLSDFNRLGVIRRKSSIFKGGGEEVDDGESEALLGSRLRGISSFS